MTINTNFQAIKDIVNDYNLKILEKEYKGAGHRYTLECMNCGFIFNLGYYKIKKTNALLECPCCHKENSASIKWTKDNIKQFCHIHGFEFLSTKYTKSIEKYWFKCKCGNKFERTWNDVYSKGRNHCGCIINKKRWTIDKISNIAAQNNVKLISTEYEDYHKQHLEFQCQCGNIFKQSLSQFLNTKMFKCHECNGTRIWTIESIAKEVKLRGATLISKKYTNSEAPMYMRCSCGNTFSHALSYFMTKDKLQCDICTGIIQWDIDKCHQYIKENTTATMLSTKYSGVISRYDFICECGEHFTRSWKLIVDNDSYFCDICSNGISVGERKIRKILKDNNVQYIREHTFDGMRSSFGGMLRFDFYLPESNIAIEFDGEQHYHPVQFGGISKSKALEEHNKTKERDISKNQYCKDNNIKLYRIPYYEIDNIESILNNIINKD